jgi:hypothetical protein
MALIISSYDLESKGIDVDISDWDGVKYVYTYTVDLEGYTYQEGEGEFYTTNPISPLELPSRILTLIVENYFGKEKDGRNMSR